jgi:hypothetical protein
VILIDAWLSLPLPALILILAAFYGASALVLIGLSFGALVGPWVRSFRGVVGPFFGAIVIIFSILVGFLANDVWDRNRRAAATVRGEGASLNLPTCPGRRLGCAARCDRSRHPGLC